MAAFAVFGPGALFVTRTDVANSTPVNIGYAQEFTLDRAADVKELFGQNKYPLIAAVGTIKLTGKVKAAKISGIATNAVFHGGTFVAGRIKAVLAEAGTIPGTPYQVTVANAANFEGDLGVIFTGTGLPATKVASSPATLQYSVSGGGVYTFAAADTTLTVQISYTWSDSTAGQKITVANTAIGTNPTFQLDYYTDLVQQGASKPYFIRLYQCVCPKLTESFKLTDFNMPELDFSIYENTSGNIYLISYPEKS